jgi:hypothetical protein
VAEDERKLENCLLYVEPQRAGELGNGLTEIDRM